MTRKGKIARLPCEIRDELNRRLRNGEPAEPLLQWLNAQPDVRAVLAAQFEGRPVNAPNLTAWKQGGYHEWARKQEALEMAERLGADFAKARADGTSPLTDALGLWVTAHYAVAVRHETAAEKEPGLGLLREFVSDVVQLRRADHRAQRLQFERKKMSVTLDRMLQNEERHRIGKNPEIPGFQIPEVSQIRAD